MDRDPNLLTHAIGPEGRLYSIVAPMGVNLFKGATPMLAVFSRDGTVMSRSSLEVGFIPNLIVPLSNGDLFIGGQRAAPTKNDSQHVRDFLGLFSSDGKLRHEIAYDFVPPLKEDKTEAVVPTTFPFGYTKLGNDDNVYMLNAGTMKMQVFNPAGETVRRFKLDAPFAAANVSGFFVSGNRVLVYYWGKTEDPSNPKFAYVIYDAEDGTTIATYNPDFRAIPVNWENGKILTVLVPDKANGVIAIGTATLQ